MRLGKENFVIKKEKTQQRAYYSTILKQKHEKMESYKNNLIFGSTHFVAQLTVHGAF
jgi:hypothetical protein